MQLTGNSRGLALTTVLLVASLLALLLPINYVLLNHAFDRHANRVLAERYLVTMMSLREQLEDPLNCSQLLAGETVPATLGAHGEVTIPWVYEGAPGPLQAGWRSADGMIHVNSVTIQRSGNVFNTVRVMQGGVDRTYQVIPIRVLVRTDDVSLNLEPDTTALPESPELLRPLKRRELLIQLHANVGPGGRIASCFGARSYAAACQAHGGSFNFRGPAALRCQPDKICFSGIRGLVRNVSDCMVAGIPYRASRVGRNLAGQDEYLCVLCHQDL